MNFTNRNFELKEIQMLKCHTNEIFHVAWNPASGLDGSPAMISSCGADKTVRIWTQNLATNSFYCMAVLGDQHTDTIRWCVWSPTGNLLVTSSYDGNIAIWENLGGIFSSVHVLEFYLRELKRLLKVSLGMHLERFLRVVHRTKEYGYGKYYQVRGLKMCQVC